MKPVVTSLALVALLAASAFADQACINEIAAQLAALNQSSIFLEVVDNWVTPLPVPVPESAPVAPAPGTLTPCPLIYQPACGVDGQAYGNACVAESQGGGLACEGPCPCATAPVAEPVTACPLIYAPVCGPTGITYGNECVARANGTYLFCQGECPCKNPLDVLTRDGGYLLVPTDTALQAASSTGGINADLLANPGLWTSRAALTASAFGTDGTALAMDGSAFDLTSAGGGETTWVKGPGGAATVVATGQACDVAILVLAGVPYSLL